MKRYAIPNAQVQAGYIKYGGVPHLDGGYTVHHYQGYYCEMRVCVV